MYKIRRLREYHSRAKTLVIPPSRPMTADMTANIPNARAQRTLQADSRSRILIEGGRLRMLVEVRQAVFKTVVVVG